MKVVILCGEQGLRLREETEYKPKPMIEIGGKPILWHIMKMYAHYGFKEFILCLGYKGDIIRQYFLNYESSHNDFTIYLGSRRRIVHHHRHDEEDWRVTLVDTGQDTPKGGRVKQIKPHIQGTQFMLTYGDGVANVDIQKLVDFHKHSQRIGTFTGVRPRSRFATVDLDQHGKIKGWKEKRRLENFINGGFFVFDRKIFDYLTYDCELEEEPMERLAAEGQLDMYQHTGYWECMDTYRDFVHLNEIWQTGKAPWAVWKKS